MTKETGDYQGKGKATWLNNATIAEPLTFEKSLLIAPLQHKLVEEIRNNTEGNPDTRPITLAWVRIKGKGNQLMLLTEPTYQRLEQENIGFRFGKKPLDARNKALCQSVMYMWKEAESYSTGYYAIDNQRLLELDVGQEYKRPRFLERYLKAFAELVVKDAEAHTDSKTRDQSNHIQFAQDYLHRLHEAFQKYLRKHDDVARTVEDQAILESMTLGEDLYKQTSLFFGEELIWDGDYYKLFPQYREKVRDDRKDDMWNWDHSRSGMPIENKSDMYLDDMGKLLSLPLPEKMPSIVRALEPGAIFRQLIESETLLQVYNSKGLKKLGEKIYFSGSEYTMQNTGSRCLLVPTVLGSESPTIEVQFNNGQGLKGVMFEYTNSLSGGGNHTRKIEVDVAGEITKDSQSFMVPNSHGLVIEGGMPQAISFLYEIEFKRTEEPKESITLLIDGAVKEEFGISPTGRDDRVDVISRLHPFYIPLYQVGLVSRFCEVMWGKPAVDISRKIDYQDQQFRSRVINARLLRQIESADADDDVTGDTFLHRFNRLLRQENIETIPIKSSDTIITNPFILDEAGKISQRLDNVKRKELQQYPTFSSLDGVTIQYAVPPDNTLTTEYGIGQIELFYSPQADSWRMNVRSIGNLTTEFDVMVWNGVTSKGKLRSSNPDLVSRILWHIADNERTREWKKKSTFYRDEVRLSDGSEEIEKLLEKGAPMSQSRLYKLYREKQDYKKRKMVQLSTANI